MIVIRVARIVEATRGVFDSSSSPPWRHHALELAKQIRAEDPRMHKLHVVTEIANRWKRDPDPCPSTGHLVRALREWEENGKLALRIR
jgi:hypothetical protein